MARLCALSNCQFHSGSGEKQRLDSENRFSPPCNPQSTRVAPDADGFVNIPWEFSRTQHETKEKMVKRAISATCFLSLAACTVLYAQQVDNDLYQSRPGSGHVITPHVSTAQPGDLGKRMHTSYKIFIPATMTKEQYASFEHPATVAEPVPYYYAETPASLACLYGAVTVTTGCNPATLANSKHATGGSKAIAIVDAYDYPTALADLKVYSSTFGLAAPTSSTFTVVYAGGSNPGADPNCSYYGGWDCWASEEALDIEMAHAIAPSAHIYLVEAASSYNSDLFVAIKKAISLVVSAGGGEVTMSWGGSEGSDETAYDSYFTGKNVVFFASTGDSEGTIYPSVSPNVVAVGGTTITRNPSTLAFEKEITWEDGGGGLSSYEAKPTFQKSVSALSSSSYRGVPDVAAVGNPNTGVWVYDSTNWCIFGGTSVASPLTAALVNHAKSFAASTAAEESLIYTNATKTADYRDVTYGVCGYYDGWFAATGWDPCTGNGAPLGSGGK
jgi:subtilase family serine protease